ncbi:MAG: hypothetical protein K1X89_06760 [Myxococcaceae bacterium]|nr:hypothetical protein [Myxococcaceae bacterium]
MRLPAVAVTGVLLAGCLTHMPVAAEKRHLKIHWAASFDEARASASAQHKPVLLCLVAGKIDGLC